MARRARGRRRSWYRWAMVTRPRSARPSQRAKSQFPPHGPVPKAGRTPRGTPARQPAREPERLAAQRGRAGAGRRTLIAAPAAAPRPDAARPGVASAPGDATATRPRSRRPLRGPAPACSGCRASSGAAFHAPAACRCSSSPAALVVGTAVAVPLIAGGSREGAEEERRADAAAKAAAERRLCADQAPHRPGVSGSSSWRPRTGAGRPSPGARPIPARGEVRRRLPGRGSARARLRQALNGPSMSAVIHPP